MKQDTFNTVAGTLFAMIAGLHVLRIVRHLHASIGGWIVPMWVSWAGLVLAGFLAYTAFRQKK